MWCIFLGFTELVIGQFVATVPKKVFSKSLCRFGRGSIPQTSNASDRSPLSKIGATLALFRSSGKIPLIKDLLKIIERDSGIIPATPLITLHGILSKPDAFLEGISFIAAAT